MNVPSTKDIAFVKSALLSDYTTFQLGGRCLGVYLCQSPEELEETVLSLNKDKSDFILIGGGSNLVVSDKGLDCYVIRYVSEKPFIKRDKDLLTVSAGSLLDQVVLYAAQAGLAGLNYCTGIPGTLGGAVVGNAGAFGQQIGDCLVKAKLIKKDGTVYELKNKDLEFRYRHSNLKECDDIVMSVDLKLNQGDSAELLKERLEILDVRASKHPDLKKEPCAGSFFRNIEPTSKAQKRQASGWFLEQVDAKHLSVGGAAVYAKHANIIIKEKQTCLSEDVFELQQKMAQRVKEKFDIDLIREVRFVGDFIKKPDNIKDVVW